jgi:hypothetical protein
MLLDVARTSYPYHKHMISWLKHLGSHKATLSFVVVMVERSQEGPSTRFIWTFYEDDHLSCAASHSSLVANFSTLFTCRSSMHTVIYNGQPNSQVM